MNLPSHNNKKLFPIDQIIELATQKGYQWGKTSPKNRLRYYTKLGFLPNAKRQQANPSDTFTTGHYPIHVIDRLLQIQKLKKGKLTTRQITAKLEIEKLTQAIPSNKLLTIQQIIKLATKKGYQWGKTSPKNRLRYYTKIGLLPHAERKQANLSDTFTTGHYPIHVIDLLIKIQNLKNTGQPLKEIKLQLEAEKLTQKAKAAVAQGALPRSLTHRVKETFITTPPRRFLATAAGVFTSFILLTVGLFVFSKTNIFNQWLAQNPFLSPVLKRLDQLEQNLQGKTLGDQQPLPADSPELVAEWTIPFAPSLEPPNLLKNSSFEANESRLSGGSVAFWQYVSQSGNNNTKTSQISARTGNLGLEFYDSNAVEQLGLIQSATKTVNGRDYTFSVWLTFLNSKPNPDLKLRLGLFGTVDRSKDPNGALMTDAQWNKYTADKYQDLDLSQTIVKDDQTIWHQYTAEFTNLPLGKSPIIQLMNYQGEHLVLDDISLTTNDSGVDTNSLLGYATIMADSTASIYPVDPSQSTAYLGLKDNRWQKLYVQSIDASGDALINGKLTVHKDASFGASVSISDFNSNLLPETDNTYNLGSSTKEWKDLYLDGIAYLDQAYIGDGGTTDYAYFSATGDLTFYGAADTITSETTLAISTTDWTISATGIINNISGYTQSDGSFSHTGTTNTLNLTEAINWDTDSSLTLGAQSYGLTVDGGTLTLTGDGSNDINLINTDANLDIDVSTIDLSTQATSISLASSTTALNIEAGLLNLDTVSSYVGIGTTAPGVKLDVVGAITASGAITGDTLTDNTTTFADSTWTSTSAIAWDLASSTTALNIEAGLLNLDTSGSKVGIGTTDPQNKLDVAGSVAIGSSPANPLPQANSLYVSGNVGIGTTNPSTFKLEIDGSIGPDSNDDHDLGSDALRWQDLYLGPASIHIGTSTSDEGTISYDTTANDFLIDSDGDLALQSTAGNVGIGTTAPSRLLDIEKNQDGLTAIRLANTNAGTDANTALLIYNDTGSAEYRVFSSNYTTANLQNTARLRSSIGMTGGLVLETGSGSNAPIDFRPNGSSSFYLKSDGNVGIGTTDPGDKLHVEAGSLNLRIAATSADSYARTHYRTGDGTGEAGRKWYVGVRGDYINNPYVWTYSNSTGGSSFTDGMVITNAGNVGIGTTGPGYKLDVNGSFRVQNNALAINSSGYSTIPSSSTPWNLFRYSNPQNIIPNGDLESWTTGTSSPPDGFSQWSGAATMTRESGASNIKQGQYSAKIVSAGGTFSGLFYGETRIDKNPNSSSTSTYTISFWYKQASTNTITSQFGVYDTTALSYVIGDNLTKDDAWHWYSKIFSIRDDSNWYIRWAVTQGSDSTGDTLYVDQITLTKGVELYDIAQSSVPRTGNATRWGNFYNMGGNVGIGTTNPGEKLHVNGKVFIGSSLLTGVSEELIVQGSGDAKMLLLDSETGWGFGTDDSWSYDPLEIFAVSNGVYESGSPVLTLQDDGKVGIGIGAAPTYSAGARLHVIGIPYTQDSDTLVKFVTPSGGVSSGVRLQITEGGWVTMPGIRTNDSGNYDLRYDTTYGVVYNTSDSRQKTNQQPLKYGLAEILQLQPKSYDYHEGLMGLDENEIEISPDSNPSFGLIAQEVNQIIPEMVFQPEDESTQFWSVNYEKLTPVLVSAIQEQQAQIEDIQINLDSPLELDFSQFDNLELSSSQQLVFDSDDLADTYFNFDPEKNQLETYVDNKLALLIKANGEVSAETFTSSGSALAENYQALDDTIEAGDVVALADNQTIVKSGPLAQGQVLGVATDNAGFVLSNATTPSVSVALAGRTTVKVDDSNGDIQVGDYLTASSLNEGHASKAIDPGWIIGRALTTAASGEATVLVQPAFYNPNSDPLASTEADLSDYGITYDELNGLRLTSKLNIGLITIDDINSSIDSLVDLQFQQGQIAFTTNGNIHVAGKIVAQEIETEKIIAIDDLNAGSAAIPQGQTALFVSTQAVTSESKIVLTPTKLTSQIITIIDKQPGQGFTVSLTNPASDDITFDWWLIDTTESLSQFP